MIRIPRSPGVLVFSLALVACSDGDDGDDGGDGVASSPSGNGDDANAGDDDEEDQDDGGGDATDNVEACQDLKATLTCGGVDYGMQLDCSAYANLTCDVSPYLECLDENFACEGGTFDSNRWMGCATQLQELLADC